MDIRLRGPARRRATAGAALAAVIIIGVAPGAAAGPPTVLSPSAGTPVCQVRDGRLNEISGMAATGDGFVMVNDSADEEARRRIFFLDADCAVVRTVRYPSRPRDTEDLGVGADGTVWVADVGDNDRSRRTIALWRLRPGGKRPVLYRLAYPDGPHDAEALLVAGDGRPVIVAKQGGGAGLYRPAAALRPGATVPLVRVGQVRLPSTRTRNPFFFVGRGGDHRRRDRAGRASGGPAHLCRRVRVRRARRRRGRRPDHRHAAGRPAAGRAAGGVGHLQP
ncbi:hypothetical protein [Micromonospora rubida]